MTYKVLYRKYRPKYFFEVVGQDNIKEILKKSIKNEKTAHAYLFTGVRGTGKTSIAKIFAKSINCLNQKDGEPCGECENCLNFDNSSDIIEIDAASNNGIEYIREITSNSRLVPSSLKYKVYIIDEVHMLSLNAYNALLKTLEEPVDHVKFILATTEIQKIPLTILSRCQRFDFSKIKEENIIEYLEEIIKKEQINCNLDVLEEIAFLSEGSLRDALSILDKLSSNKKGISIKDLENSFGSISNKNVEKLAKIIDEKKPTEFIEFYKKIKENGYDISIMINKMINYYKNLIYSSINTDSNDINYYKKIIIVLLDCQKSLKLSSNVELLFEINILSLILEKTEQTTEQTNEKTIEKPFEQQNKVINNNDGDLGAIKEPIQIDKNQYDDKKTQKMPIPYEYKKIRINNCFVEANKPSKIEKEKQWKIYLKSIEENNLSLFSLVENSQLEVASEKYVIISIPNNKIITLIDEEIDELEKQFSKLIGKQIKMCFLSEKQWKNEKEQYLINKNKKYEIMIEPILNSKKDNVSEEAINLFGQDIVDIR